MTPAQKSLRAMLRKFVLRVVVVAMLIGSTVVISTVTASPAKADVGAPSWWSGACNKTNNPGSYALGASFNGVQACGPGSYNQGGTDRLVHFYTNAWGEYEWECVELVMRYMYLVYGIAPYNAPGGKDVVANYSGTRLTPVPNDGNSLPSPGDIISIAAAPVNPTTGKSPNPYGHTAVVTGVSVDANGNGTLTDMQQNASGDGWGTLKISGGKITGTVLGGGVSSWLHDPNGSSSSNGLTDGTFFQNQGSPTVYEMVGGAALPVPGWASVGGNHTPVMITSPVAYPATPRDGTYIVDYGSTAVYVMAGGAAIFVPSWASVGGQRTPVVIPAGYSFPSTPTDGTFIQDFGYNNVYEMVGGAALFVPNWSSIGGYQEPAVIPATVFPSTPADGTLIQNFGYSAVYEIAGGAAFQVPYWGAIGGARPFVVIPATVFPQYPTDGTFIADYGGSTVYEVAGGSPVGVTSWGAVGGSHSVASVPIGGVASLRQYPADGTFVIGYGQSTVYEMVGGSALAVTAWSAVGGSHPVTTIDNNGFSHFLSYPADGTYVLGYGSGEEFVANSGAVSRVMTSPLPAATAVDDWAIINQLGGTE
jgi:hypothetical protein